jgi:hypothetical protein
MNMPDEIILAVKEKKTEESGGGVKKVLTANIHNLSILDKIVTSYNTLQIKKDEYSKEITTLKQNASILKQKIYTKKHIKNNNIDLKDKKIKKERSKKRIEDNNYSITEETCNTTIDYINIIRTNISSNSKAANEALTPLEESFNLLKVQVQYTVLLENILKTYSKSNELEDRISESDQIITMLAESLEIELLEL